MARGNSEIAEKLKTRGSKFLLSIFYIIQSKDIDDDYFSFSTETIFVRFFTGGSE